MDQFDVFENPNRNARRAFPYVVVLQSDVTRGQQTVIVAPLSERAAPGPVDRLTPAVEMDGRQYAVLLQSLAAIRSGSLRASVARLDQLRDMLPRAIDLLFLGF